MFTWMIKRRLERIGRRADPDPAFVTALQKRFGTPRGKSLQWRATMATATSVAALFLGTGTYAYASDSVLPNHPLYGVRVSIESAETALAFTPTMKARARVHLMSRRLREEKILAKKQMITPERLNAFIAQAERAIEANRFADERVSVGIDQAIAALEEEHASLLEQLQVQGVDAAERERVGGFVVVQTTVLRERIQALPPIRKAQYRTLLERKLQLIKTAQIEPLDAAKINLLIADLEAAYADISAQLDQETTITAATDQSGDQMDDGDDDLVMERGILPP